MEPIRLNEADADKTVKVAAGQQVIVRLPENPTTGYRWTPPAGVQVAGDEYALGGTAMGAGGERVFTLAEVAPGEARFELKRSWGSDPPERTFTLRFDPAG